MTGQELFWDVLLSGVIAGLTAWAVTYWREQNANNRFEAELKSRYELASLDKRLQAHQEAYALWWEMLISIFDISDNENEEPDYGKSRKAIFDCLQWWVQNNLYLREDARMSFDNAIFAGKDVLRWSEIDKSELTEDGLDDLEVNMERAMKKVRKAGKTISESIGYIHRDPSLPLDESTKG